MVINFFHFFIFKIFLEKKKLFPRWFDNGLCFYYSYRSILSCIHPIPIPSGITTSVILSPDFPLNFFTKSLNFFTKVLNFHHTSSKIWGKTYVFLIYLGYTELLGQWIIIWYQCEFHSNNDFPSDSVSCDWMGKIWTNSQQWI